MNDWRPSAEASALKARASLYQNIRAFFSERDVLEVETPLLARHGVTDLHIDCIPVPGYGVLQSSPEYHMKRLLADGAGAIFQISRVFRAGERGRRHNPEFSLLEWYRPEFSLQQLIDESISLLRTLLPIQDAQQVSFRELFKTHAGIDPLTATQDQLAALAVADALPALDKPALVDWLMATRVEPALPPAQLTVVVDFPGWAAALARTRPDADGEIVAERFEIYAGGLELANGYHELADADEQRQRFEQDQQLRAARGKSVPEADDRLLAALEHGLPDCSGVAMGLDRLLMLATHEKDIARVLAFDHTRA